MNAKQDGVVSVRLHKATKQYEVIYIQDGVTKGVYRKTKRVAYEFAAKKQCEIEGVEPKPVTAPVKPSKKSAPASSDPNRKYWPALLRYFAEEIVQNPGEEELRRDAKSVADLARACKVYDDIADVERFAERIAAELEEIKQTRHQSASVTHSTESPSIN